ncbi:MAG: 30S ribosomal protein S20 [Gammaproteobacteria bacterium]|nr:MAG: 30S ribosomal protein S20 [Gammaproteobacteria bacterium]RLA13548.1 MAG: 30S ribosomal protein S20 [Gammaproteobacteria bacterium]RLA15413.1 MAG: 30S ribosomal protein S20 [Gammaproteobacteria bacterium]
MANSPQARKRARQAENRRQRNSAQRSSYRTALKKVSAAIEAGDSEAAKTSYAAAIPTLDRSAGRGLVSKNTVARWKSRLNTQIRNMA